MTSHKGDKASNPGAFVGQLVLFNDTTRANGPFFSHTITTFCNLPILNENQVILLHHHV